MTEPIHDVAVVGVTADRLADAGVTDIAVLDDLELASAAFDEATHTWSLPTCRARVIVTDQIRSGRDDLAPYLGVAVNRVPNYFMVSGAGAAADAQLDYIAGCLGFMKTTGSTRIEVLYSAQRMFARGGADRSDRTDTSFWQRAATLAPTAFDMSSHVGVADEVYDGKATLRIADGEHVVRVRLSGRVDPIDGRYHWQGTILGPLPGGWKPGAAALTIGEQTVECRITERTQQGGYSVAGVGMPPYTLDDVEVVVPLR